MKTSNVAATASTSRFLAVTSNPVAPTHLTEKAISIALGFANAICGRVHIVVDNSNQHQSSQGRGDRLDHELTMNHLGGDQLLSASIVVSQPPTSRPRPSQMAFFDWLTRIGWSVHRYLPLTAGDGTITENEISVDGKVRTLIRAAADDAACDAIVLISGDGGMTSAVRYARLAGKKVFVVAWSGTMHPALAGASTAHTTIEELRPLVGRVLH